MKQITSVTMHKDEVGQCLSYTYSVIDENTGAVTAGNQRQSVLVPDIPANEVVLGHVAAIMDYVKKKEDARNG